MAPTVRLLLKQMHACNAGTLVGVHVDVYVVGLVV